MKKRAVLAAVGVLVAGVVGVAASRPVGPCVMRGAKQPPGVCQHVTKGFGVAKGVPFPASESVGDCLPVACESRIRTVPQSAERVPLEFKP